MRLRTRTPCSSGTHSMQQRRVYAFCPLPEVRAGAGCSRELANGIEVDVDSVSHRVAAALPRVARHDVPAEAERLDAGGVDLVGALSEQC
jgi:hypothetical protein